MSDTPAPDADTDFYQTPAEGWTCFHCGENFPGNLQGRKAAQQHFGGDIDAIPGCRLRMRKGERSLLRRIRWLENKLRQYQSEDSDKDREMQAMEANHIRALRQEEEKGYALGLRDARNHPELII